MVPSTAAGAMTIATGAAGLIEIKGQGQWSRAQTDAHFNQLVRTIDRVRETAAEVRVLVDMRRASCQPQDTAERIAWWAGRIYGRRDRVAVLVGSCVAKAQLRGTVVAAKRELFVSESAARLWLMA